MTDWQPIETAPTDGTRVLAYVPDCPQMVEEIVIVRVSWGEWTYFAGEDTAQVNPTHWMPLPSAPVAASPSQQS